jgi:hypothetical protein
MSPQNWRCTNADIQSTEVGDPENISTTLEKARFML